MAIRLVTYALCAAALFGAAWYYSAQYDRLHLWGSHAAMVLCLIAGGAEVGFGLAALACWRRAYRADRREGD